MRTRLHTAVLFPLLVLLAFASARNTPSVAPAADDDGPTLAHLEAPTDLADSTPLHAFGEVFSAGTVLETPRRLNEARLQIAAGLVVEQAIDDRLRAGLSKLRAAERDRREIGDALQRDAAGSTSFHTTTPPPPRA